jgi:hypothetical protein
MKKLLAALGMLALNITPVQANGKIVYFKGSDAVAQQAGGVVVPGVVTQQYPAAQVSAAPSAVVAAPAVATAVAATPTVTAGCVNCTPGSASSKNYGAGTPNAIVTFLHPYTNKAVSIPMTLPVGKPTLITRSDRIIYDYGKFGLLGRYIVVRFYPDGTVMVKYH